MPPPGTHRRIVVERSLVDDVPAQLAALQAAAGDGRPAALAAAVVAAAVVESGGRGDAEVRLDVQVPRRDPGFADSVGPFGTVVALRSTVAGTGTELLDRVRDALGSAGRATRPARTLVRHEPAGDPPAFDGLTAERVDPAEPVIAHERVVTLVEHPGAGGVSLRLAVDAAACDAAGAAALVRRLAGALDALLRDPAAPVSDPGTAPRAAGRR
ncbi:hypothetical protein GCM10023215_13020 [Pseudonocardia yuanmonensis]|uniref:Condensation domain-containing protein n=1 Tax=Pseudonocardia yuanmonensis TaxID=1095914 RepID=A0ABP8W734_9PSEU